MNRNYYYISLGSSTIPAGGDAARRPGVEVIMGTHRWNIAGADLVGILMVSELAVVMALVAAIVAFGA